MWRDTDEPDDTDAWRDTDEIVFSHRNRMRMAFWAGVLLALWGFLFIASAPWAFNKLEQTPLDPNGYQVVRNRGSGPEARAATAHDMQREKYKGVIHLAFSGAVFGAAGFLLVTALADYRTRFLGWAIGQLPRNQW